MPYWLESDTFADEAVWDVLAGGDANAVDHLQAAYCRLKAKASHIKKDGYLTEQTAIRYARRRRWLDLLCTPVLDEQPLLHRPDDDCPCLGDTWIDGYAYRIHNFLRRNPSRTEYERNRAQRADLRSAPLKAMVYARDGGACRYCRSGPLSAKAGRARDRRKVLTYDHVDPDKAAGEDGANLVVCCGRCNEYKGHRTPYEADMVLLPEPTPQQRGAWAARDQVLNDLPDHQRITDETATDHRSGADPITDPVTDPNGDRNGDPNDESTGQVYPQHGGDQHEQRPAGVEGGTQLGRVGHRRDHPDPSPRPTQPARPPDSPDIYHRRSRPPALPPPEPHYVWPPGAVPATPPAAEEDL
ncbi:HNH endonuclease [Micromonospora mangrovi]|uniref:HNH nuclease domain-containing protein n=2 Tax=Micromonospora TaxID=1873 RepID=A0AAU7M6Q1_9ACTN